MGMVKDKPKKTHSEERASDPRILGMGYRGMSDQLLMTVDSNKYFSVDDK